METWIFPIGCLAAAAVLYWVVRRLYPASQEYVEPSTPQSTTHDSAQVVQIPEPIPSDVEEFIELPEDSKALRPVKGQPGVFKSTKGDPSKVAILFGINKCSPDVFYGDTLSLRGCVNDTNHMKAWLDRRGYGTIYHYADKDATVANFLKVWKQATAGLKDGDTLLLHMSRHGMSLGENYLENDEEVTRTSGKETYSGDQGAVMHDGVIIDDCFWRLFMALPKVKLIYVNDSCHSGTQYKVAADYVRKGREGYVKARGVGREYMPQPDNVLDVEQLTAEFPQTATEQRFTLISISGCQDWETSADAFIGGKYQGAMTASLLSSLYANPASTPKMLETRMSRLLKSRGYDQNPRIAIEGDQSFWGQPLF